MRSVIKRATLNREFSVLFLLLSSLQYPGSETKQQQLLDLYIVP